MWWPTSDCNAFRLANRVSGSVRTAWFCSLASRAIRLTASSGTITSGINAALARVAPTSTGPSSNNEPVVAASSTRFSRSACHHDPPKRRATAVVTSALLTTNHTAAAAIASMTSTQPGLPPGANGSPLAANRTRAAAPNDSAYCPALNAARHGLCCRRTAEATTAAVCTTTAAAKPHISRIANVKQMDGNTTDRFRPGGGKGRRSAMTARAASNQYVAGECCGTFRSSGMAGMTSACATAQTTATYPKKARPCSGGAELRSAVGYMPPPPPDPRRNCPHCRAAAYRGQESNDRPNRPDLRKSGGVVI